MDSHPSASPHPSRPRFIHGLKKLLFIDFQSMEPAKLVFLGYCSYVIAGWILLCLPFSQKIPVTALDNLFIATSAVSTTGLVTVSVADSYTWFGQFIVLLLIQLGGIGYMTFGSFIVLSGKTALSPVRRKIGQTVFSLPATFELDAFIKKVMWFTVIIELIGAACLYVIFKVAGLPGTLWSAIFHSVSSFCTAGFGLYNNSFEPFVGDFSLNIVVGVLSYLGAMGFIVCVDFWHMARGQVKQMTLTSRIIIWSTIWLSVAGTLMLLVAEPSLKTLPMSDRILAAFFQCMTATTTVGFNTVSIGALSKASVLLLIILMVIGSSPAGTGGGLKTTTFTAMLGVMKSALRGERDVRFWGKKIPIERVWMAFANIGFYLITLVVGVYFLDLVESTPFDQNAFEAASALGTVGLSMGITPGLTSLGKIIITFLMFAGRVGPLTMGAALFFRKPDEAPIRDEDLAV